MAEASSPEPEPQIEHQLSDELIDTGFAEPNKIRIHREHADQILRDRSVLPVGSDAAQERRERYEHFTKALLRIQDYGIEVAGIGNARRVGERPDALVRQDWQELYTTTQRIDGKNMYRMMNSIPPTIVVQTVENMLRYYEDMLKSPGTDYYLTDLCLDQCLYGRPPGEAADGVYFIDLEIDQLSQVTDPPKFKNVLGRITKDIDRMEQIYRNDFSSFRERLSIIAGEILTR